MYSDFEMQGIEEDKLNSDIYQAIMDRIKMEEAAASVSNGLQRESDDIEYVVQANVCFSGYNNVCVFPSTESLPPPLKRPTVCRQKIPNFRRWQTIREGEAAAE